MSAEHREFNDPDALTAALPGGSGRYRVLGRGEFSAELTVAAFAGVTLQCADESLARIAFNALPSGRVGILGWLHAGPLPVVGGVQMRVGDLMSVGGGTESYHRTSASVAYVALIADANELERVAIDLAGRELRFENELVCLCSSPATSKFVSTLSKARDIARASPGVFESAEAVHALEQELVRLWIECLPDGAPRAESAVQTRRARIMARFEEVVEANAARPLHLPELCRLVGVPERTLRKCCQQHLGMGPHQYLLLRRIHLARRALLRGNSSGATVTSIATKHGFWDLGRFAVVYRSMFGEAPSATLRRPQAEFA